MRPNPNRGRVYRRCGCRDERGRQFGASCPQLTNPRHGSWALAVDMPSADRKRKTMRRSGYDTRSDARAALARVLECERAGVYLDDAQTVADYLIGWLDAKARRLKPTTVARYRDYLHNDLLPAFGAIPLERLTHRHVDQFVRTQLAAGPRPGHRAPLHRHAVQRTQRRDPPTPAHPQRRPLHGHTTPGARRASMLDRRGGGRVPALLPPGR